MLAGEDSAHDADEERDPLFQSRVRPLFLCGNLQIPSTRVNVNHSQNLLLEDSCHHEHIICQYSWISSENQSLACDHLSLVTRETPMNRSTSLRIWPMTFPLVTGFFIHSCKRMCHTHEANLAMDDTSAGQEDPDIDDESSSVISSEFTER